VIPAALRTLVLGALLGAPALAQAPPAPEPQRPSVGMIGTFTNLVLPGSELEAVPADVASKVVVRVVDVRPHGTAHRYQLEFVGLEAGNYDLRGFLRRKDGTSTDGLPELPVEIVAVRPAGLVEPNELQPAPAPRLGGYRTLLWVGGAAWVVGLLLILFVGRRKKQLAAGPARAPTLAERLQPIVEDAIAGRLDQDRLAELERLLLGFWRQKLDLVDKPVAAAIPALRRHEEAGALLRQLELWLHAPPGAGAGVDVAALLRPYENLPAEPAPHPSTGEQVA
jgi:hypothetical protein